MCSLIERVLSKLSGARFCSESDLPRYFIDTVKARHANRLLATVLSISHFTNCTVSGGASETSQIVRTSKYTAITFRALRTRNRNKNRNGTSSVVFFMFRGEHFTNPFNKPLFIKVHYLILTDRCAYRIILDFID